jgi:glycosyltransferase involved in cell wall biosynthesis
MTKVIYIGYYNPNIIGTGQNQTGYKIEQEIRNTLDYSSFETFYINIIPKMNTNYLKNDIHEINFERNNFFKKASWAMKLFYILKKYKFSSMDKLHVITYNHNPVTKSVIMIYKKIYKMDVVTTQLLMDYPAPLVYKINQTKLRNYLKGLFDLVFFKRYQNFIGLSKFYHPILKKLDYKYIRFPYYDYIPFSDLASNNRIVNIGYFGGLESYNGIESLIKISRHLESNCNIHIFGKGSLENKILTETIKSNRIHFHGYIDNNELLFKTMTKMNLLIFLSGNLKLHKFQFPSKIYDYLISGVPTIINDIRSIDSHTSHYLIKIVDNNIDSLIRTIYRFRDEEFYRKEKINLARKGRRYMEIVSTNNDIKKELFKILN